MPDGASSATLGRSAVSRSLLRKRLRATLDPTAAANSQTTSSNAQDAVAMAEWTSKRWLWIPDSQHGYLAAHVVEEIASDEIMVQISDEAPRDIAGEKRTVKWVDTEKMNPPKFDKVEDMADLAYLNEASVVHNLRMRYFSDLIYVRLVL